MQRLGPARAAATLLVALIVVGCGTPQVSPPPASASAIASAVASDAPSAATWQPGPEAPIALIEQATAVHDGRIWTAGGLTADGQAVDTVLILDPASGEWSEGPPLPIRLHHAALVSDGVDLWLLGGYLGDTFGAPTDVVRRLPGGDPEAAWEVGSPLPQLRAAGAAVWDGGHFGEADDLAQFVDGGGHAVAAAKGAEVSHHAVVPQEGVAAVVLGACRAHHLAGVVDVARPAVPAAERAEIACLAVLMEERMLLLAFGRDGGAEADHLPGVVQVGRELSPAAERWDAPAGIEEGPG
jgi:hypothetical protein